MEKILTGTGISLLNMWDWASPRDHGETFIRIDNIEINRMF